MSTSFDKGIYFLRTITEQQRKLFLSFSFAKSYRRTKVVPKALQVTAGKNLKTVVIMYKHNIYRLGLKEVVLNRACLHVGGIESVSRR